MPCGYVANVLPCGCVAIMRSCCRVGVVCHSLIELGGVVSLVVPSKLPRGPDMWEHVRVPPPPPIGTLRCIARPRVVGCLLVVGGLTLGK